MPAFLGATQILSVSGSATINYGDIAWMSPKSSSKSSYGSGGAATGALVVNNSLSSFTLTNNGASAADQPIAGNN